MRRAVPHLEDSWLRHGREYSGSLHSHATNLTWAADDYRVQEDQAREVFQQTHVGYEQQHGSDVTGRTTGEYPEVALNSPLR